GRRRMAGDSARGGVRLHTRLVLRHADALRGRLRVDCARGHPHPGRHRRARSHQPHRAGCGEPVKRPWLWLAGLYATMVLVTVVWVSIDRRPPEWDHANHLERALRCRDNLAGGRLQAVLEESAFYPPLALCTAGILYFVFPVAAMTAQAVMLLFLAIGIAAVFALGRDLWGDRAGLLAAFFFATAPFVVFSLLNFQLDLPLAAM